MVHFMATVDLSSRTETKLTILLFWSKLLKINTFTGSSWDIKLIQEISAFLVWVFICFYIARCHISFANHVTPSNGSIQLLQNCVWKQPVKFWTSDWFGFYNTPSFIAYKCSQGKALALWYAWRITIFFFVQINPFANIKKYFCQKDTTC